MATVLLVLAQSGPSDALREQKPEGNVTIDPVFLAGYKAGHADGRRATRQKGNYCLGIRWREFVEAQAKEKNKKADPVSEADPRTTDYCAVCGESPDSGTHLFKHDYVRP